MRTGGRARFRGPVKMIALAVALCLVAAGCTVNGSGNQKPPNQVAQDVPASQLKIIGDGQTKFDIRARNALTDVEQYWKQVFPSISNGKTFVPLKGGVYSVTTGHPNSDNACMAQQPTSADNNAFYCPPDDSFAYDRTGLVGQLADQFGPEYVMVVIAHEFGHLIQNRLGIDAPSILLESQADCAAGAFTASEYGASVPAVKDPHFRELPPALDQTIVGLILLRDSQPHNASDPQTHGTGFDRASAFSDGFHNGAKFCYSNDWTNRQFTERPYVRDDDYAAGGNLAEAQIVTPTGGLIGDLNAFWAADFGKVGGGKKWQEVQVKKADHPACADSSVEFGYCPNDNTIYYSDAIAEQAYNSVPDIAIAPDGKAQYNDTGSGDYALGTLFTVGFGMAALHQSGQGIDDGPALMKAVCYAGAYSNNINVELAKAPRKPAFVLSPPDMDEATYAVLRTINQTTVFGSRNTTGLDRIQSFRKGYLATDASGC